MRLVILESPFAGNVAENIAYARKALHDCLMKGESPIASHLLLTQPDVLDDDNPREHLIGLAAGHAWYSKADAAVVYVDHGISNGMRIGIELAKSIGVVIEFRSLVGDREKVQAALTEFSPSS